MKGRWLLMTISFAAIIMFGAGEAFCRLYLGLGDPPLTVRDPEIDYLFAPNQQYRRFGRTISYNHYSMRADDAPVSKDDPAELRILVIGDSVINGGVLTDDSELGTQLLQKRLHEVLNRPVWVGNISAGSWGPGNQLAYLRKFGTFDADIAILVLSTHDLHDVPEHAPDLGPDFPERPPMLATAELLIRYLPRYLPAALASPQPPPVDDPSINAEGERLLETLLADLQAAIPHVIVLHHPAKAEATMPADSTETKLASLIAKSEVPYGDMRGPLAQANSLDATYRDDIHPSTTGQRVYASVWQCIIRQVLDDELDLGACSV